MEPVANVDAIVTLLRRRLVEKSRREEVARGAQKGSRPAAKPDGAATVRALAAIEGVGDRELGRTLVQSILVEHFGDGLLNEPKFQQVVDRVSLSLAEDREASAVFRRVLAGLRATAR